MKYFYLTITLLFSLNSFSQNNLLGEWYLHSITKSGVEEINIFNPTFHINFTLDPIEDNLIFNGMAICKDYFGGYNWVDENTFEMINLSFVLSICQETGGPYEDSYLSFFAEAQSGTMPLTYNITGIEDDETLVVTSQNGDFVVYGRQTLSFEENKSNDLSIRLKENPVWRKLKLDVDQTIERRFEYAIFTMEGKQILHGKLSDVYTICTVDLNSGMYFLFISSDDNYKQTLKFLKQ